MKNLIVSLIASAALMAAAPYLFAEPPTEDFPPFAGFMAYPANNTAKGLAQAINDLIKEDFTIQHVRYHERNTFIMTDKGKCTKPTQGRDIERKYESIKAMGPDWEIGLEE